MPIEVGYIEDLFWNNGRPKYPNKVPDLESFKLLRKSPVLTHYTSGYINLTGNYNYCRYKNKLYFLIKGRAIDPDKEKHEYFLVYDFWCNILQKSSLVNVLGTVNIHNDEKLLADNLQTTRPALFNPSQVVFLNFTEKDRQWLQEINIKKIEIVIPQKVLSADEFLNFSLRHKSREVANYQKNKKFLYKRRSPIFIFDYLKGSDAEQKGWKNQVIEKINEALDHIKSNPDKWNLQKVQNTQGLLSGKYCLTRKDKPTIGTGDVSSQYRVENIDLSNLEDIISLNTNDLTKVTTPNKPLTQTNAVFDVKTDDKEPFIWRLTRKAYLPIKSKNNNKNFLRAEGDYYASPEDAHLWITEAPQEVKLKNSTITGYLWWLDKLDFTTVWPTELSSGIYEKWESDSLNSDRYYELAPMPAIENNEYGYYQDQTIFGKLKENTPGYGFLMFQTFRPYSNWRTIEYIGNKTLNRFDYISGFKNTFLDKYGENAIPNKWWADGNAKLNRIAGDISFSRLHLNLEGFAWLNFAPKCYSYQYAYDYSDGFGQMRFVNPHHSRLYYYTAYETTGSIWWKGNIERPEVFKDLNTYIGRSQEREQDLKEVITTESINLPWEVNKGDYFFSSLEYSFKQFKDSWIWLDDAREMKYAYDRNAVSEFPAVWSWDAIENYITNSTTKRLNEFFFIKSKEVYVPWWQRSWFHMPSALPVMEDFTKDYEKVDLVKIMSDIDVTQQKQDKGVVVLCNNLKNSLEYRILQSFSEMHYLSQGNQIVESVDGVSQKDITYYKLSKHGLPELDIEKADAKGVETWILYLFYKAQGIPVRFAPKDQGGITGSFLWYDEEDLKADSGLLFDLVGTDWYAYFFKENIHFISKSAKEIKTLQEGEFSKGKSQFLDVDKKPELKDLNIISLINQRSTLMIYTQPYFIENKFKFDGKEYIGTYIKATEPSELDSEFVWNLIHVKTPYDSIIEWLPTTKKPNEKIIAIPDRIAKERINLETLKSYENYDINSNIIDFQREKQKTAFDRAKADLDWNNYKMIAQAAGSFLGGLTGGVVAGFMPRKWSKTVHTLRNAQVTLGGKRKKTKITGYTGDLMDTNTWSNYSDISRVIGIGRFAEWTGGVASTAIQLSRWGEFSARIDQDRGYAARDLMLQSNQLDTEHFRKRQNLLLEMNSISNQYNRQSINQMSLQDEFNKLNNLQSKFLKVQIPSEEELVLLRRYTDEFGVDCFIDRVDLKIYSGMPPVIIRYSFLDKESNYGELTEMEKNWLIDKLTLSGIRIVLTSGKPNYLVPGRFYRITSEKEALEKQISFLTTNEAELLEEIEKLKLELEKCKDEAETEEEKGDDKRKKIKDLQDKLKLADERLRETAQKAHDLETRLADTIKKKEELEGALLECQNQAPADPEEVKKLKDQLAEALTKKEEAEGKVLELSNTISGYTQEQLKEYGKCIINGVRYFFEMFLSAAIGSDWEQPLFSLIRDTKTESHRFNWLPYFWWLTLREDSWERDWDKQQKIAKAIGYVLEGLRSFVVNKGEVTKKVLIFPNDFRSRSESRGPALQLDALEFIPDRCPLPEPKKDMGEFQEIVKECERLKAQVATLTANNRTLQDTYDRDIAACNTRADNLRDSYEKANAKATEQQNLANLYRAEKEQKNKDLIKCQSDLAAAKLPKDFDCPIPDSAEYGRKYKRLEDNEWHEKFNLANKWRLKTNELAQYNLLVSVLYYYWKTNYNNDEELWRSYLRSVVETIHAKSNNWYLLSGVSTPYLWTQMTQRNFNSFITRADTFFQYIRDTLPRPRGDSFAEDVRAKLNALVNYTKGKNTTDWMNEDIFKEIGKKGHELLTSFIQATKQNISITGYLEDIDKKRKGAHPINKRAKEGEDSD